MIFTRPQTWVVTAFKNNLTYTAKLKPLAVSVVLLLQLQ